MLGLRPADHRRVHCGLFGFVNGEVSITALRRASFFAWQAGHKSMDITIDVYGHFILGGNRAAVDRLDDAFEEEARQSA
jgi:hypothetical protein